MKRGNRRSKRSPLKDHVESWDMSLVNLLGHVLPEHAREEWLGDLKEARLDLLHQGWSNWAVMLITITRACLLVWSLLRIKYQDLGLVDNGEISREKLVGDLKTLITDAEELLKATTSQAGDKVSAARQRIEQSLIEGKNALAEAEKAMR